MAQSRNRFSLCFSAYRACKLLRAFSSACRSRRWISVRCPGVLRCLVSSLTSFEQDTAVTAVGISAVAALFAGGSHGISHDRILVIQRVYSSGSPYSASADSADISSGTSCSRACCRPCTHYLSIMRCKRKLCAFLKKQSAVGAVDISRIPVLGAGRCSLPLCLCVDVGS